MVRGSYAWPGRGSGDGGGVSVVQHVFKIEGSGNTRITYGVFR